MLNITQSVDDVIILADAEDNKIGTITIASIKGGQVKLRFDNDQTKLRIYREKLWKQKQGGVE